GARIYALSLHDALPICGRRPDHRPGPQWLLCPATHRSRDAGPVRVDGAVAPDGLRQCAPCEHTVTPGVGVRLPQPGPGEADLEEDRKSTRLNSSHVKIS